MPLSWIYLAQLSKNCCLEKRKFSFSTVYHLDDQLVSNLLLISFYTINIFCSFANYNISIPVATVTTVTSHPILCTPSRVYMQPCSPWTRPDPTRSTSGPFRPLSSPLHALCSICDAYVSAHDVLLLLSVSREHR